MFLKDIKIKDLAIKSNILIAPLAGYTNLPFRKILRKQNAGLLFTEMISAEGLNYNFDKSSKIINSDSNDKPLGIQIFGADPERIGFAFEKLSEAFSEDLYDIVDLNCGCPVKKIIKSKAGAYLLQYPDLIFDIISKLKALTNKPVSFKIRSGWDNSVINFKEVYYAGFEAGADMITFHSRTKSQMFNGYSDWEKIAELKSISKIPVIGNGDIFTGGDAVRMMELTKCDGVMLARGVIENPFLAEEVYSYFTNEEYISPDLKKRADTVLEHLNGLIDIYGERKGLLEFRKVFRGYFKGFPAASTLRHEVNKVIDYNGFSKIINDYILFLKEKTSNKE